jgi:hypothetical protein
LAISWVQEAVSAAANAATGVIDAREPGSRVYKAAISHLRKAANAAAVAVGSVPKQGERGRGGGVAAATSTGTAPVEDNDDEDYSDDSDDGKNSLTRCLNIIRFGETIDRNSLQYFVCSGR